MRLVLTLGLAALLAAVPGSATAANNDTVDGTVEDAYPSTLHVNAISDANGANPRGHFYYRAAGAQVFDEVGDVTCMQVAGDRATVGGRIDRSKMPGFPGEGAGFQFIINDNGEPGDTDSHLDLFQPTPPTTCLAPVVFSFPYTHGNFQIHDAAP